MRKGKYILTVFLILGFIGTLTVFLPQIMTYLNNYHFFSMKVNDNFTRLSRLEFIKICVSVFGPILTVMVFLNTLKMQEKTEKKQEELELKQQEIEKNNQIKENEIIQRELLIQIDKEFYVLLDLFLKCKDNQNLIDKFTFISEKVINDKTYGFINDYSFRKKSSNFSGGYKNDSDYLLSYWSLNDSSVKDLGFNNKEEINDLKYRIINEQFEGSYRYTGNYFKILHRIIKTLNEYLDDKTNKFTIKEYSKYIGILRTQITSNEFVGILYNSIYVKRGLGLGLQLIGSGLFGDKLDFKTNQHFETPDSELFYLLITDRTEENINIRIKRTKELADISKEDYQKIQCLKELLSKS
ncbi:putative phage abortive infection protein [Enterococcus sp. 3C8_DIV0646]|uniref:putative phage abortive infection protein n=1 Tax=Enterococcus sp. 3C8_DIV0646 TaxID=1834175 RepID=UPI000A32E4A1|nr:putative phage abortive infection protein [Enterococcus sp. 3C8_DIV0646]OTO31564.1 hypothetical protein A5876_002180 [Enterococcus sp. 3C8_DIV0646]